MRFPLAYYLVLLYLTVLFKPLIPVIGDAYSHTFGEAIHLATVHAKQGSNHLEQSLAKTGNENNSKNQKDINAGQDFLVHIRSLEYRYDFSLDKVHVTYIFKSSRKPSSIFLTLFVPPPRC